jgi:hypothetical protein
MSNAFAMSSKDTILVYATVYKGDTIPLGYLHQITIWGGYKFKSDRDKWAYINLKRDVLMVYPYAMKASQILVEINNHLASLHANRERKRYIHAQEKVLNDQFKSKLVNMNTRQGRLLMLLIDRQTGSSCYELVKEFKGGFKAWTFNSLMSIYDDDLNMKRHYTKEEYPLLDQVLFEIETQQVKVSVLK